MTDRFYPMGLPQEQEHWKTTYEVQNEMRSFPRSAFPPGTSVHQPGTRDSFGFSCPGPIRERLAQGHLHPTEEVDIPNPRLNMAMPLTKAPDEMSTFHEHDIDEMGRSYRSPVAAHHYGGRMGNTGMGGTGMGASMRGTGMSRATGLGQSRSLPALVAPPRVNTPPSAVKAHQDDHFDYFVPKGMQRHGRDKLNTQRLQKLHKGDRISFPFSGEGTGFRSQSGPTQLFPEGTYEGITTSTRTNFSKPNFFRLEPLSGV